MKERYNIDMPLKLMYITNIVPVAEIAEQAGVDRIWVDLEYIGKEERQKGLNTVKSHHTLEDVSIIRKVVKKSELLVRVNPINEGSEEEINEVVMRGADIIMLPMFRTVKDVQTFLKFVNKRTKVILLIETPDAVDNLEEILKLEGIDEVHIGMNDLSLAYKKPFMFDLLAEGTIDKIVETIKKHNIPYGFGGVARLNYGLVPSEYIIREHYRLGSSLAILSRSFCNANTEKDIGVIRKVFIKGIQDIREEEKKASKLTKAQFEENRIKTKNMILDVDFSIRKAAENEKN